jgi:hypothetical protein
MPPGRSWVFITQVGLGRVVPHNHLVSSSDSCSGISESRLAGFAFFIFFCAAHCQLLCFQKHAKANEPFYVWGDRGPSPNRTKILLYNVEVDAPERHEMSALHPDVVSKLQVIFFLPSIASVIFFALNCK